MRALADLRIGTHVNGAEGPIGMESLSRNGHSRDKPGHLTKTIYFLDGALAGICIRFIVFIFFLSMSRFLDKYALD